MKIEFSLDGKDAPYIMHRMSQETGIPVPKDVLDDFSSEIRRIRGRFVHLYDHLLADPPADAADIITQASIDMVLSVQTSVRNFVLFCFIMFWPMETTVYMRFSPEKSGIDIIVTSEGRTAPKGFKKLV